MKQFPKLDLPASEVLRLHAEGKLWIVHNANTFEPYLVMADTKKVYYGDDDDFWNYVSLVNRMNIQHNASKGIRA